MSRSPFLFAALAAITLVGCDAFGGDDTAVLTGVVVNAETSRPLTGATVQVIGRNLEVESDSVGGYEASFDVDSTETVTIIAFKTGYAADTVSVLVESGQALSVPALELMPTTGDDGTSGPAASITLAPRSSQSIGVSETGAQETAQLVFIAHDADGQPVDNAHAVEIAVGIINGPDGGEFLSPAAPETVRTDENGEATVTLTSGTAAGVVQIETRATVNGREIRSQPITLAIHGGFPSQSHFSVYPTQRNHPLLGIAGASVPVSVIVGDRYANPVQAGTQVYFTSDAGVIQGSAQTDGNGQTSTNLITGNPFPADGFVTVTARTSGIDGERIEDTARILLSGTPVLTLETPGLDLGTYTYTVSDGLGNPLAEGSTYTVSVEGENVAVKDGESATMPDTQDRGVNRTQFQFTIGADDPNGEDAPRLDKIEISVSGPNGSVSAARPGRLDQGPVTTRRRS
ncbi:hypothetical protein [Rubrivirga sp.]|uniref:hypothetical protein n=1 Tax=Rubrivirga sp. TaxID=1885344 RepID=UPI003C78F7DF